MDIVILSDFLGRLDGNGNSRFLYLADYLCKGNNVEVITSNYNHGTKEYFDSIPENENYKITMLHESAYPKNVCLKRFYAHFVFGGNVGKYLSKRKKPDVIYCAVPTLFASYQAAKYCKKNKIKFIIDVQDLWPEAFQMVFNIPVISDIIFFPFRFMANGIYKRADEIVAVSKTYCERVMCVNKKCKTSHTVFLGTKLADFDKNAEKENKINFNKDKLLLAYCGTLGSSYDLSCVIDALKIIKERGQDVVQFVVMGDGPRKEEFENYAKKKNIDAFFAGRLEYADMCATLCECDMVVNPITKGAAQSIINKHADYVASGLPVLNTQECEEYRNLVEEYNMGFNCRNNDAQDLAEKMLLLINDERLRKEMGKNARRCAEERFDRANTYKELIELITH